MATTMMATAITLKLLTPITKTTTIKAITISSKTTPTKRKALSTKTMLNNKAEAVIMTKRE